MDLMREPSNRRYRLRGCFFLYCYMSDFCFLDSFSPTSKTNFQLRSRSQICVCWILADQLSLRVRTCCFPLRTCIYSFACHGSLNSTHTACVILCSVLFVTRHSGQTTVKHLA